MGWEANVPSGLWPKIQKMIDDSIAKVLRAGLLQNASISGLPGLTVSPGSKILVRHPNGDPLMLMGAYDLKSAFNMPDGSCQPMALIWRADGSLALGMYDPNPADGFQQFLAMFDRNGNIIVSDDTNSGFGLARPHLAHAFYPSRAQDFLKSTAASWETVWRARVEKQQPQIYGECWGATDTSGTTGQVRLMVNGVQLGATQNAVAGTVMQFQFGPAVVAGNFGDTLNVELQAQRTAGTGNVQVGASWVEGAQS